MIKGVCRDYIGVPKGISSELYPESKAVGRKPGIKGNPKPLTPKPLRLGASYAKSSHQYRGPRLSLHDGGPVSLCSKKTPNNGKVPRLVNPNPQTLSPKLKSSRHPPEDIQDQPRDPLIPTIYSICTLIGIPSIPLKAPRAHSMWPILLSLDTHSTPKPKTQNPKPKTLNPKPIHTLNPNAERGGLQVHGRGSIRLPDDSGDASSVRQFRIQA